MKKKGFQKLAFGIGLTVIIEQIAKLEDDEVRNMILKKVVTPLNDLKKILTDENLDNKSQLRAVVFEWLEELEEEVEEMATEKAHNFLIKIVRKIDNEAIQEVILTAIEEYKKELNQRIHT
jgi:DNA-binding transcriptional MerR regulator